MKHSNKHIKNCIQKIEYHDGTVEYFQNDVLHNIGNPAVITPEGTKYWYQYGVLHNPDGPAKVFTNGKTEFWLEGVKYEELDYYEKLKPIKKEINIVVSGPTGSGKTVICSMIEEIMNKSIIECYNNDNSIIFGDKSCATILKENRHNIKVNIDSILTLKSSL